MEPKFWLASGGVGTSWFRYREELYGQYGKRWLLKPDPEKISLENFGEWNKNANSL